MQMLLSAPAEFEVLAVDIRFKTLLAASDPLLIVLQTTQNASFGRPEVLGLT